MYACTYMLNNEMTKCVFFLNVETLPYKEEYQSHIRSYLIMFLFIKINNRVKTHGIFFFNFNLLKLKYIHKYKFLAWKSQLHAI